MLVFDPLRAKDSVWHQRFTAHRTFRSQGWLIKPSQAKELSRVINLHNYIPLPVRYQRQHRSPLLATKHFSSFSPRYNRVRWIYLGSLERITIMMSFIRDFLCLYQEYSSLSSPRRYMSKINHHVLINT